MTPCNRWVGLAAALIAALVHLGGSAAKKSGSDLERLRQENLELREALDSTREAMELAESQRQALEAQLADMQGQMATQPYVPPPAAAPTGFEGIRGVETEHQRGQITVRIPGDILFDPGKTTLKSAAKKTLTQIADVIKRDHPTHAVRVAGHTDTDPIRKSRWADNLELSLQRAAAVHRQLQKLGVSPKKMYAAGYGQWHPRGSKAKSRRVEIVVVLNE